MGAVALRALLVPASLLVAPACGGDGALEDDDELAGMGGGAANDPERSAGMAMGEEAMSPAPEGGAMSEQPSPNASLMDEPQEPGEQVPMDSSEMDPDRVDPVTGETGRFIGMTAAHNATRAMVETGGAPLPDLTWSPEIAEYAQQWADVLASTQCGFLQHRAPNMYGENLASKSSRPVLLPFPAEEAVDGWAAEIACWDYGTINGSESCDQACAESLFTTGCGHYTQLVWRDTRQVGCGYATCETSDGWQHQVWVCNYDPPGNFIGRTPY